MVRWYRKSSRQQRDAHYVTKPERGRSDINIEKSPSPLDIDPPRQTLLLIMSRPSTCRILAQATLYFIVLQVWVSIVQVFLIYVLGVLQNASFRSIWDAILHDFFNTPSHLSSFLVWLGASAMSVNLPLAISIAIHRYQCGRGNHRHPWHVLYKLYSVTTSFGLVTLVDSTFLALLATHATTFPASDSVRRGRILGVGATQLVMRRRIRVPRLVL